MKILAPLLLAIVFIVHASATTEPFYLAAKDGIYHGALNSATGELAPLDRVGEMPNVLFLAQSPTQPVLYAATDSSILAFKEASDGSLQPLGTLNIFGKNLCHLTCDATGRFLLVADYDKHSVNVVSLGGQGEPEKLISYRSFGGAGPNKLRQEASHPHGIYLDPENRHAYMCDLGSDRIWMFDFNAATGALDPMSSPSFLDVKPGSGPRHLAFSQDGREVYVNGELGANLFIFHRDEQTGRLSPKDTVSTLTPDRPATDGGTGEIVLHPSGKWLYVSNRLGNTIALFSLAGGGAATLVQDADPIAVELRSFGIDPTGQWLVAAGVTDNRIAVLKIDLATGGLTYKGQTSPVPVPICVLFVPAPSK
jgi:6-phosphogluconolactonase